MKKLTLIAALTGALSAPAALTLDHLYPATLQVTDIDEASDIVTLVDYRGWLWAIEGVEDWNVGDWASAIFYDNLTPDCHDDVIVKLDYERPDLVDYYYTHR